MLIGFNVLFVCYFCLMAWLKKHTHIWHNSSEQWAAGSSSSSRRISQTENKRFLVISSDMLKNYFWFLLFFFPRNISTTHIKTKWSFIRSEKVSGRWKHLVELIDPIQSNDGFKRYEWHIHIMCWVNTTIISCVCVGESGWMSDKKK